MIVVALSVGLSWFGCAKTGTRPRSSSDNTAALAILVSLFDILQSCACGLCKRNSVRNRRSAFQLASFEAEFIRGLDQKSIRRGLWSVSGRDDLVPAKGGNHSSAGGELQDLQGSFHGGGGRIRPRRGWFLGEADEPRKVGKDT